MASSDLFWNFARLAAVIVTAGALAACAQSSVSNRTDLNVAAPQSPLDDNRTRVAARPKKHSPLKTAKTQFASHGIASFYSEDQKTANGEDFNPKDLTAAHPTLPFGTRLRVTNVATGRSVTVRINDRGPFVPGRVVDVSYSAAQTLGIVGPGTAKVKLDVLH